MICVKNPAGVDIADPITPAGKDFASVVKLRDAVRQVMLARSGEPDLGEMMKPAPVPEAA